MARQGNPRLPLIPHTPLPPPGTAALSLKPPSTRTSTSPHPSSPPSPLSPPSSHWEWSPSPPDRISRRTSGSRSVWRERDWLLMKGVKRPPVSTLPTWSAPQREGAIATPHSPTHTLPHTTLHMCLPHKTTAPLPSTCPPLSPQKYATRWPSFLQVSQLNEGLSGAKQGFTTVS